RLSGVVVCVDAEAVTGYHLRDAPDDGADLLRQRAAIGIAQHDPAGAGFIGGPSAGERISRIRLVAVEEMLAVDHRLAPGADCGRHTVANRGEVLLIGRLQRNADVIVP